MEMQELKNHCYRRVSASKELLNHWKEWIGKEKPSVWIAHTDKSITYAAQITAYQEVLDWINEDNDIQKIITELRNRILYHMRYNNPSGFSTQDVYDNTVGKCYGDILSFILVKIEQSKEPA